MATYVLTSQALGDFRDIARYTKRQWGAAQALKYRDELETCAELIALGGGSFKSLSEIHPELRVGRCQHHYIYCLLKDSQPALIVAILHERMDLMARIADRLK